MTAPGVLLIGNDTLTQECGARLLARGFRILAVVTRAAAVADWAGGAGLAERPPGSDLADRLPAGPVDWLFSVANLELIPGAVLARPRRGAINFHDGPLPRHAGLNAPAWALIAGEPRHGIAWHLIEGGIDEGDLLVTREVAIAPRDTAVSLNLKCFEAGLDGFGELLDRIAADRLERRKQALAARSFHYRADRPEGLGWLDFRREAAVLDRLVRGLDHGPYRNPLCLPKLCVAGRLLAVGEARPGPEAAAPAAPGTVLAQEAGGAILACGAGTLWVSGLRDMDGQPVAATDLAPGALAVPPPPVPDGLARREPHWRAALAALRPAALPGAGPASG
ncbi:formyltransferase family protein, partial [Roseivivax sp. CAU 1761]